jgi:SAM-dependent methyltransferase
MSDLSTPAGLRDYLLAEYDRPFTGWNFAGLAGRRVLMEPTNAWDYAAVVTDAIATATTMLDMDTGGGEFLAGLPSRAPTTYATEGFPPNLPVARRRLEPLGVQVHEVADSARLPFHDGQFDLVINRHGSYTSQEIRRVLAHNGLFITQQVGDQANRRLHELLGDTAPPTHWDLATAVNGLEASGLRILERREMFPISRFFDIGAVVYYLKAIPWEIPDFSVDKYFDRLVEMHHQIQSLGYLDVPFHQFMIRAQRE